MTCWGWNAGITAAPRPLGRPRSPRRSRRLARSGVASEQPRPVSISAGEGFDAPRRVEFLPLGSDAVDASGVIALVASTPDRGRTPRKAEHRPQRRPKNLPRTSISDCDSGDASLPGVTTWIVWWATVRRCGRCATRSNWRRRSAASVSIVGPAGSGRQHVAHAIHYGRLPLAAGELRRWPVRCSMRRCSNPRSAGLAQANAAALQAASPQAAAVAQTADAAIGRRRPTRRGRAETLLPHAGYECAVRCD